MVQHSNATKYIKVKYACSVYFNAKNAISITFVRNQTLSGSNIKITKQVSRDGPHSAFQLLLYCLGSALYSSGLSLIQICIPWISQYKTFVTQSAAINHDYILPALLSRFILITLQNAECCNQKSLAGSSLMQIIKCNHIFN
ncbi:Hypothetical_protein [Hexamita inflata]|uniref:Hypothetical_protein n=1 Tax=Hexamita inflata TaxID=28002 RepID=A0AA86PQU8_9EUKA|nr:Hypothetical protein HINF_LOCUS27112 [Hexamita inflata]